MFTEQDVGEHRAGFGEMKFDRTFGDNHARSDFAMAKAINAAHHKGLAGAWRKAIEGRLQATQFITCDRMTFRARHFGHCAQRIKVGNSLKWHDLLATHAPDQKMTSAG